MKSDDTPMYDDPSESAFVRDLLQAGRRANVEYDVERGLAKHLATISAGGAAPYWLAGATAAKRSVPLWVGYVSVPLAAAGVAGLLWVFSARPETRDPAPQGQPRSEATAPVETSGIDPAGESAAHDESALKPGGARANGERRVARSVARSAAASTPARGARSNASPRPPSESPAVALGDEGANRSGSASPSAVAANPYIGSTAAPAAAPESQAVESAAESSASPRAPEPAAAEAVAAAEEPEAEDEATRPAKKSAAVRPIVDESRLEREMQMLAVTQRVLASDPERALRLAQQGEREFPGTMFSAERRQLALLALVKLGRLDEARQQGRPFLARYPKAPWSERLRRALATGQVE